jgi:hypothetical protein
MQKRFDSPWNNQFVTSFKVTLIKDDSTEEKVDNDKSFFISYPNMSFTGEDIIFSTG